MTNLLRDWILQWRLDLLKSLLCPSYEQFKLVFHDKYTYNGFHNMALPQKKDLICVDIVLNQIVDRSYYIAIQKVQIVVMSFSG